MRLLNVAVVLHITWLHILIALVLIVLVILYRRGTFRWLTDRTSSWWERWWIARRDHDDLEENYTIAVKQIITLENRMKDRLRAYFLELARMSGHAWIDKVKSSRFQDQAYYDEDIQLVIGYNNNLNEFVADLNEIDYPEISKPIDSGLKINEGWVVFYNGVYFPAGTVLHITEKMNPVAEVAIKRGG